MSLTEGFDTTTPADRLLFHILAALAGMERELIRERTLAGIARAKAEGRLGGRKTVMSPQRIEVAARMLAEGRPVSEVARVLGVGRAPPSTGRCRSASNGQWPREPHSA